MNSVPLRRLIRKHGNLGYLLVGAYLFGYWLFHFKRRHTLALLTFALMAVPFLLWTGPATVPHGNYAPVPASLRIAAAYTLTDLGVASGYKYSFGEKLNNKGQCVGFMIDTGFSKIRGFAYANGQMTDIGALEGDFSFASGINDAGQVVGGSVTGQNRMHAIGWHNGKMFDMGTLGGKSSYAYAVNNRAQAVGTSSRETGFTHAFLWEKGRMSDLGEKCPGLANDAIGINDNGDVAGSFTNNGETFKAFLYHSGKSQELPTLGGDYCFATGLSSEGHVVGLSNLKPDNFDDLHGFVWRTGKILDIGTLGGEYSVPTGVNSSGQVVGWSDDEDGYLGAFVWQNGKMSDLNDLIPGGSNWELYTADGINDKGQIIGTGAVGEDIHAYLLTPNK